ncbi:GNAT family N-acetyltransferase [uncultured Bacteroides sp.]|uniref:GNAT family N-acetyltransferase n=1 Tax=uncultured Bacteroides sp. TaxID=162156 RepID=UPI00280B0605|nr:GNAT family N-acetyltransferase [uncultured Bacteroides sp.]
MATDKIHPPVKITRWDRRYRDDFIHLNREWIEKFFCLEESDLKILGDPEGEIIRKGGEIFLALDDGKVVGCCALVYHPETGRHELAKMAVSPTAQGRGIGFLLGTALLEYSREHGITDIFLEANTRLEASVRLYYKLGFQKVEAKNPAYNRCNLYMEKILER